GYRFHCARGEILARNDRRKERSLGRKRLLANAASCHIAASLFSQGLDDPKCRRRMKGFVFTVSLLLVAGLALGTWGNPNFWRTPDQGGEALLRKGKFAEAAKAYSDPWRKAVAQYRNGDFEAAAKTFARVPGPEGAFDQGNAWLMHGKYDEAIASYDRALSYRA